MFKQGSPLRRRPSPSMIVATLALFVALSGGAYAAVSIPADSVGSAQLRPGSVHYFHIAANQVGTRILANNSVTYQKIAKGEIGHARVAQNQIQWRINGTCTGASAVRAVTDTGNVACGSTLPLDYSTAGLSDPLASNTAGTVLASESLPAGGTYHITSTPYLEVRGNTTGTQNVTVTCELAAGPVTETRSATVALTGAAEQQAASIPMSIDLPAGTATTPTTAELACARSYDGTVAPTVQASAGLDALQTQNNITAATPGTSTTAFSLTTPTPTPSTTTTTATTTTPTTTTGTTTTGTTTTGTTTTP